MKVTNKRLRAIWDYRENQLVSWGNLEELNLYLALEDEFWKFYDGENKTKKLKSAINSVYEECKEGTLENFISEAITEEFAQRGSIIY